MANEYKSRADLADLESIAVTTDQRVQVDVLVNRVLADRNARKLTNVQVHGIGENLKRSVAMNKPVVFAGQTLEPAVAREAGKILSRI